MNYRELWRPVADSFNCNQDCNQNSNQSGGVRIPDLGRATTRPVSLKETYGTARD